MSEKNEAELEADVDSSPEAAPEPEAASEPEAEPGAGQPAEPAPEPEAEPVEEIRRQRQWVTLLKGSMDVRGGVRILSGVANDLRSAVGKPHACALVHEADAPADALVELERGLSDQGFSVRRRVMPEGGCDLAAVGALDALLAEERITADDLVVAVGGEETLSVASFACSSWCGGTSLAEVPLDAASAITAGVTPRALDLPGLPRMIGQDGSARFSLVDLSLFDLDPAGEPARLALALAAATAMCDCNKAFERLWDRSEDLAAGDVVAFLDQLLDSVKSRGKVISSTAVSTRQSIAYGAEFARALTEVTGGVVPASAALADGMRFAARMAVAEGHLSVDDMFTQDELLERLGLGTTEVAVDADALASALREERYRRTNRFMLAIPRTLGRVRPTIVTDELLAEHTLAWCSARGA